MRLGRPRDRRLKEIPGNLAQTLRAHAATNVIYGDHRVTALGPQDDANPLAASVSFGVLIRCIGDELVQGVFGILICLAADQDGLGEVSDPQADFLCWHLGMVSDRSRPNPSK